MNADQPFTKQSAAARGPSLRLVPQQHSFVMFYIVCLQTEDSDAMKRAVSKLVRAYDRMIPECAQTQAFSDLLIYARNKIVDNESTVYEYVNHVYDYIIGHRLVSDVGDKAELSDDEGNCDDFDETMEAIREQIQNLQVMNLEN